MSDTITVQVPVQYRKFVVPDNAVQALPPGKKQDGFNAQNAIGTSIAQLNAGVLDQLAEAWIEDLYRKANRTPPTLDFSISKALDQGYQPR